MHEVINMHELLIMHEVINMHELISMIELINTYEQLISTQPRSADCHPCGRFVGRGVRSSDAVNHLCAQEEVKVFVGKALKGII